MSECVVPIEKPKTCKECFDKCRCFGAGEYFQDGTIWCGIAKEYLGEITKCPIIPLPEGHGRLGDLDELAAGCDAPYWCRWLSEIEDAPTIVPAEAERSET